MKDICLPSLPHAPSAPEVQHEHNKNDSHKNIGGSEEGELNNYSQCTIRSSLAKK